MRGGHRVRAVLAGCASTLVAGSAWAYETDQLTDRDLPIRDSLQQADAKLNAMFADAVAATNTETRCKLDADHTQKVLADHLYATTAGRARVKTRGFLKGFGYGRYSAWYETDPDVDRRTFYPERRDIYGNLKMRDSLVLGAVGPCSTFNLGGVLLGSDKLDHFLGVGYQYYQVSQRGKDLPAALKYGTATELSLYGLWTSSAFSYADLRANFDGYRFYVDLLGPESVFSVGDDGCVQQDRPFSWKEWVDVEYDEVENPSVYSRPVQERVLQGLHTHKDSICASYARWGADYGTHLTELLDGLPSYVSPEAAPQVDSFQLDALCGVTPDGDVQASGDAPDPSFGQSTR